MAASRKLLILDLNGTLLVRAARSKRVRPAAGQVRLRTVYLRPYLQSFREYLFHSETEKWLDTMVWSSAQPQSVADMVQHCFADAAERLLTIWARDTFGLTKKQYYRKTRTIKDLTKPWAAYPIHSAKTTLLLDDSVYKAHLQPWNHICVPEYVASIRAKDLAIWEQLVQASPTHSERFSGTLIAECKMEQSRDGRARDIAAESSASRIPPLHNIEALPPRSALAQLPIEQLDSNLSHRYDEVLLAVIGILEHLKEELDVSGWIRAGGLSAPNFLMAGPISVEGLLDVHRQELYERSLEDLVSTLSLDQSSTRQAHVPHMWFEHGPVIDAWASKGRSALRNMNITIVSGLGD